MDSLPSTVKAHDVRIKSLEHRAENIENEIHDLRALTEAVAVTSTNVEQLTSKVGELHQDVKDLKEIPAKRWDGIIMAIATGVVGALIGAILTLVIK